VLFEYFHKTDKVGQATTQPIELVGDDHVDPTRFDVAQEPLESRSPKAGGGVTAVVKLVINGNPALVTLALDVREAGLPSCM
jgi:hypothetical protein